MKKKMFHLIIVFFVAGLYGSTAFAFDPLGPPTAGFTGVGQTSVALEYSWSKMDLDMDGIPNLDLLSDTIENFEFNKIYTNLGLGSSDGSELFLRLGVADADPDKSDNSDNVAGYLGKSDQSFLLGGGVKFTLYKREIVKWGLLAQMSWANYDFDDRSYSIAGHNVALSTDIEIFEVQFAVGPAVNVRDNIAIYGGPFLHFLNGKAEQNGTIDGTSSEIDTDLKQDAILGAYVGIKLDITSHSDFNVEFQTTDAGYAVGGKMRYRF